jgi:ApaG protein
MTNITITQQIKIEVTTQYVVEQSDPDQQAYFFAYHIQITNLGYHTVKLLTRHWIICNANGETFEVKGEGVVGQQPTLKPNQNFSYTSACPLNTPMGVMQGSFRMINLDQKTEFDAIINPFTLALPYVLN